MPRGIYFMDGTELADMAATTGRSMADLQQSQELAQQMRGQREAAFKARFLSGDDELDAKSVELCQLLGQLGALDWSDSSAILSWLGQMEAPTNSLDWMVPAGFILVMFERHGFAPFTGEQTTRDFNPDDRDSHAARIVSQGLRDLRDGGYVSDIVGSFIRRWQAQFGA